jgi:hypothetical protein
MGRTYFDKGGKMTLGKFASSVIKDHEFEETMSELIRKGMVAVKKHNAVSGKSACFQQYFSTYTP